MTPDPKPKTIRDAKYKDFIRSQPCLVCIAPPRSMHHHEPINYGSGTGTKGPDNEALPLCVFCHNERHYVGRETFYNRAGIDWVKAVLRFQELYKDTHK